MESGGKYKPVINSLSANIRKWSKTLKAVADGLFECV